MSLQLRPGHLLICLTTAPSATVDCMAASMPCRGRRRGKARTEWSRRGRCRDRDGRRQRHLHRRLISKQSSSAASNIALHWETTSGTDRSHCRRPRCRLIDDTKTSACALSRERSTRLSPTAPILHRIYTDRDDKSLQRCRETQRHLRAYISQVLPRAAADDNNTWRVC